ncbi:MAG: hypothetical protein ACKERG_00585 [Candidatus Hodgkinia cicadicola]
MVLQLQASTEAFEVSTCPQVAAAVGRGRGEWAAGCEVCGKGRRKEAGGERWGVEQIGGWKGRGLQGE